MGDPLTVHSHLALIRGEQTNHQVEGGGFSSSIGTEQADHLAGGKLQIQALHQLAAPRVMETFDSSRVIESPGWYRPERREWVGWE